MGRSIALNNRLFVSHLGQRFTNSRLLKLTADEMLEAIKMKKIINSQKNDRIKSGILVAITNSAVEPIILLTGVIVLSGAVLVFDQNLANLGLFTIILIRGVPLVRNIFAQLQKLEVNWYALKAIIDTFKKLDECREDNIGKRLLSNLKAPEIKFQKVDYKYKYRKEKAINSISFKIPSGSLTAIIGPSGAGKSTIIDCIPRLKAPKNGKIFINNVNIKNYDLFSLRKSIGFIQTMIKLCQVQLENI